MAVLSLEVLPCQRAFALKVPAQCNLLCRLDGRSGVPGGRKGGVTGADASEVDALLSHRLPLLHVEAPGWPSFGRSISDGDGGGCGRPARRPDARWERRQDAAQDRTSAADSSPTTAACRLASPPERRRS